ncbi:hypothetical protein SK128_002106 [Halocaridina rubra]|uniref:Uncharacterized protein n=1 Tax=Halocaridina rubra TaxID=373956 RepID=A0AAN8ZXQ7_HALRR
MTGSLLEIGYKRRRENRAFATVSVTSIIALRVKELRMSLVHQPLLWASRTLLLIRPILPPRTPYPSPYPPLTAAASNRVYSAVAILQVRVESYIGFEIAKAYA